MEAFPLSSTVPAGAAGPTVTSRLGPELPVEDLHPALWRAHQVGRQNDAAWPTGFAALDAELPGRGWPARVLTELLLPHPGVGEFRLLAPALVAVQQAQRSVMLFDPPAAPCGWALAALGLDMQQLVVVRSRSLLPVRPLRGAGAQATERPPAADALWALEQALKSGHVGAVLAWLPRRLRPDALRRLQLAAQGHDGPAFLVREVEAHCKPSAAPLRLLLESSGPDEMGLRILKRRGPPLAQPLRLELPAVLSGPARQRALRHRRPAVAFGAGVGQGVGPDVGLGVGAGPALARPGPAIHP